MTALKTKTGSIYLIDEVNKMVTGGSIGNKYIPFISWSLDFMGRGCIIINDEQYIHTSPVTDIWECNAPARQLAI